MLSDVYFLVCGMLSMLAYPYMALLTCELAWETLTECHQPVNQIITSRHPYRIPIGNIIRIL